MLVIFALLDPDPDPKHFFSDLINFQYYIEVVPTVVDSYLGSKVSYQYSVKVWMKKCFLI